jgi:peroxiredoxin
MRRDLWIILCVILLITNLYFGLGFKKLKNNPFSGKIVIEKNGKKIFLPFERSLLTLIIYFSYRSCEECMRESYWWNKLFKDLSREEISIVGIAPGNEEIEGLKDKYKILFPMYFDKNLNIAKRFLISITPFRIIMNKEGRIFYIAPADKEVRSQERFYFVVIELLRKVKQKEAQKYW